MNTTTSYDLTYQKVFHQGEVATDDDIAILHTQSPTAADIARKRRVKRHDDEQPPAGPWGPKHAAWMFGAMARETADFVRKFVAKKLTPLEAEINELRRRLAESETKGWQGVLSKDVEYDIGAIVTHGGAGWACIAAGNKALTPGQSPTFWKLAIKAGRDGRECKCSGGGR